MRESATISVFINGIPTSLRCWVVTAPDDLPDGTVVFAGDRKVTGRKIAEMSGVTPIPRTTAHVAYEGTPVALDAIVLPDRGGHFTVSYS